MVVVVVKAIIVIVIFVVIIAIVVIIVVIDQSCLEFVWKIYFKLGIGFIIQLRLYLYYHLIII